MDLVGITTAEPLEEDERHLATWLGTGFAGEMAYMARNLGRRAKPRRYYRRPRAICLGIYYPGELSEPSATTRCCLALCLGKDYHRLIEHLLDELAVYLKNQTGSSLKFKAMVDHGPALEKAPASGGWVYRRTRPDSSRPRLLDFSGGVDH